MKQSSVDVSTLSKWTLLSNGFGWGVLFGVFYFIFTIASGMLGAGDPQFLLDLEWSDSSLSIFLALYLSMIATIFFFYGYIISAKIAVHPLSQLMVVLPVTVLGFLIWFLTYRSLAGATSDIGDLTWLFFHLFVFWATPIFEMLAHYLSSSELKLVGLFVLFLPGLFTYIGLQSASYWKSRPRKSLPIVWTSTYGFLILSLVVSLLFPRSAMFTLQNYPRVDGATAAIPFGKVLVRELTGVSKVKADRSVRFNTTHDAYVNLITKNTDIIFVSGPSDEELKLAEQHGVKLKLTPIGKDAFIFLVHRENQVDQLTVSQIQDIYSGKSTNWKEVGGEDYPIIAFQREKNSGSQTFMEKKVMKDVPLAQPPTAKKSGGMGGLIEAVADYQNSKSAIGYSFYYFANEMHQNENVKFLKINGVEPNKINIKNDSYPYTAILYAVTREGESSESPANQLLNWIVSEEGSQAIVKGGFIPVK